MWDSNPVGRTEVNVGIEDGLGSYMTVLEYSRLTFRTNGSDCWFFDIQVESAGIKVLIGFDEALAVLSSGNCGGVRFRIVDISPEICWDQFLLSTLWSSLWSMLFSDFPGIVILLLSIVGS